MHDLGWLQVNETLLRSIVTQPSSQHYVYAYNFTALSEARNALVTSACLTYVPDSTTTSPSTLAPVNSSTYRNKNCSVCGNFLRFFCNAIARYMLWACVYLCVHQSVRHKPAYRHSVTTSSTGSDSVNFGAIYLKPWNQYSPWMLLKLD